MAEHYNIRDARLAEEDHTGRIRVLEPIHFTAEPDQERYSRARVMDASEMIRGRIQDALYDMLRTRRSTWW